MRLEVLISCMYQKNASIINCTGIQTDVLVINQCNYESKEEFDLKNKKGEICQARIINTKERGLSKSRNMALQTAKGDICLFCDDDEQLVPEYPEIILNAFLNNPAIDGIVFWIDKPSKRGKELKKVKRLTYIDALQTSSVQIAFRRERILERNIRFDELMGSGTGNGGGEEVKFLFDCLQNKLNILCVPQLIGSVKQTSSGWFSGFTPQFMRNQGWTSRRIMGALIGYVYIILFVFRKYKLYKNDCSFWRALKEIHMGFFEDRTV